MTDEFQGKVIMVTGASAGIGKEISLALLDLGAGVVACSRDSAKLEQLKVGGSRGRGELLTVTCDVSRSNQVKQLVDSALAHFGKIDCLINNAGIYPCTPVLELSEEEWDQVLDTNLKGAFLCSQAVAKAMISEGIRGSIVNVGSTASLVARPGAAHYAASKAGMNMLTKSFALELAPYGIRVNAVLPGLISTERVRSRLTDPASAAEHRAKLARIPLKREGAAREITHAVFYFLAHESGYSTGSLLVVDGGYSLGIPTYEI